MNIHREAFEAWAKSLGYSTTKDRDGDYIGDSLCFRWFGWCAAVEHLQAQPSPAAAQQRATVAAMALQGLLANGFNSTYEGLAEVAVKHADALLANLEEKA